MATILNPAQIATALRKAGFPESELPRMTAVALAESGGNTRAHNPNAQTGDNSYGLWQVNMLGSMGPERRKQFGLSSNEDLFDPVVNARAARGIFDSQGPNAWSVVRSGAYKKYLAEAEQGVRGTKQNLPATTFATTGQEFTTPQTDDFTQAILKGLLGGGAVASTRKPQVAFDPTVTLGLGGDGLTPVATRRGKEVSGLIGGGVFDYLSQSLGRSASRETMSNGEPLAGSGIFGGLMQAILSPSKQGSAMTLPSASQAPLTGGGTRGIVEVGKLLQGGGLRVREHPEFGGVGGHSNGSLHYEGKALDLTDWQDPGESQNSWLPRKKWMSQKMEEALRGTGAEVYGPHNDPKGHGTHIHLGLPSGSLSEEAAQRLLQIRQEALKMYPLGWNN